MKEKRLNEQRKKATTTTYPISIKFWVAAVIILSDADDELDELEDGAEHLWGRLL